DPTRQETAGDQDKRQGPQVAVRVLGPQEEHGTQGNGDVGTPQRGPARTDPYRSVGLEGEEDGAVQGEQGQGRQPPQQGVGVEQIEQGRGDDVVGTHGHAPDEVGKDQPPQEGGDDTAEEDRPVPPKTPPGAVPIVAVL